MPTPNHPTIHLQQPPTQDHTQHLATANQAKKHNIQNIHLHPNDIHIHRLAQNKTQAQHTITAQIDPQRQHQGTAKIQHTKNPNLLTITHYEICLTPNLNPQQAHNEQATILQLIQHLNPHANITYTLDLTNPKAYINHLKTINQTKPHQIRTTHHTDHPTTTHQHKQHIKLIKHHTTLPIQLSSLTPQQIQKTLQQNITHILTPKQHQDYLNHLTRQKNQNKQPTHT